MSQINLNYTHLGFAIKLIEWTDKFDRLSATKKKLVIDLIAVGYVQLDENNYPQLTEKGEEEIKVAAACFAGAGK
jgi:Mn-dependent DtxR family transcriptional regulator